MVRVGVWTLLFLLHEAFAQASAAERCGETATVSRGDTLTSIAQRCGLPVTELLAANPHIRNPDIIRLGTTLALPRDAAVERARPADDGLRVKPQKASRGKLVAIEATGLAPNATVWIKGGTLAASRYHLMLRATQADAEGSVRTRIRVPRWAKLGASGFSVSIEVPRSGAVLGPVALEVTREMPPLRPGDPSPSHRLTP